MTTNSARIWDTAPTGYGDSLLQQDGEDSKRGLGTGFEQDEDTGIIPFADECEQCAVETASSTDSAFIDGDLSSHLSGFDTQEQSETPSVESSSNTIVRSFVDRDLGLDELPERQVGKYACPCCGQGARRMVRVRLSKRVLQQIQIRHSRLSGQWVGLCAVCAASMLSQVPGTVVGGMIRPSRRRLKRAGGIKSPFRRAG